MSTTPYIPRLDSVPDKVCRYFIRLPDEELLTREVASKFGITVSNVSLQLAKAVAAGYLQVDGSVYSAGANLALFKQALESHQQPTGDETPDDQSSQETPRASTGFHAWLDKKGQQSAEGRPTKGNKPAAGSPPPDVPKSPRRAPAKAFFMDLSEVVIVSNVPLPGHRTTRMDWMPILDRLAVGDSFELPAEARSSVSSAATKFKKATGRKLALRVVPNGIRVWRVE